MQQALAYRKKYFTIVAAAGVVMGLFAFFLQGSFDSGNGPDAVTYGALAFSCLSLLFFGFYAFDPSRVRARFESIKESPPVLPESSAERLVPRRLQVSSLLGPQALPRSLEEVGKTLAALAATLIAQPILMGSVVFTITGDLWRQLLFFPVALLAGVAYWFRIRAALERLSKSDLT